MQEKTRGAAAIALSGSALFIQFGSFSLINASLRAAIGRMAPQLSLDVIDIKDAISRRPLFWASGAPWVLMENGVGALASRRDFKRFAFRSRWFQNVVRKMVEERAKGQEHLFTLQTQSLFDASLPGSPHAIYTDHAALARRWSAFDDGHGVLAPSWIAREREIYARATHVFTCGSRIRDLLISDYGLSEDQAVRAGAGANVATTPGGDFAARNVLFIGVDWERKGGPDLVKAMRIVRHSIPEAMLTIAGCTPDVDEPGVVVLGRLPAEELKRHYRRATAFCMPSRLEPFGIVYIEALHAGLPIIASDVGDLRDIVIEGENGFLVPPADPQTLAQRLIEILADPARAQAMGRRSAALSESFTWDAVATRILERMATAAR